MKKLLLILALIPLFWLSSCNSKEKAIADFMFENLYDYNSYQAIETKEYSSIATHRFRCKTAGGISKINEWTFCFNENGTIRSVYDESKKEFIYIE